VIVNGSAQNSGGWEGLGTHCARPVALEPELGAPALSPNHSFTVTRFRQLHGADDPTEQERLDAIVRLSEVAGFDIDAFRSRTTVPGEQFHDYLYHNLGNQVKIATDGAPPELEFQPMRFKPISNARWQKKRTFLSLGWHFFEETLATAEQTR
jgi:hypothetical protein